MTHMHTCETCRFWARLVYFRQYGKEVAASCCRKNAPRQSEPQGSYWPLTDKEDWCGEHQRKEGEHDAELKRERDEALAQQAITLGCNMDFEEALTAARARIAELEAALSAYRDNADNLQRLFAVIDEVDALFDQQTYDDKKRGDFDNHENDEVCVTITHGLERRVSLAAFGARAMRTALSTSLQDKADG